MCVLQRKERIEQKGQESRLRHYKFLTTREPVRVVLTLSLKRKFSGKPEQNQASKAVQQNSRRLTGNAPKKELKRSLKEIAPHER